MGVILTISFKVTAEIETYVLHRTSQTRCIGFVKHRMYVLSFIHCHEMRSVFVVVFFLTVSSAVLPGSIIFNGVCWWIFRGKGFK